MSTPFTPRRSTRGAVFTPTPFHWTSAPLLPPSALSQTQTAGKTYYNSFTRITTSVNTNSINGIEQIKGKGKGKGKEKEQERRFTVGDGVVVGVEGGSEGIGILVRLWEVKEPEEDGDDGSEAGQVDGKVEKEAEKTRMMGEIHWCFRRQDLPGIMKNLTVADVSQPDFAETGDGCDGLISA
jgi:origin recognition complex subunit 1